jgi:trans-2,3-dihydro-3-hydroxyanthranilate isomerase
VILFTPIEGCLRPFVCYGQQSRKCRLRVRAGVHCRAMPAFRYVLADVFTDRALTGNQLAVFTDARELDTATMQALAREMNFSESVFVLPAEAGGHARIRIFTPESEAPFAGHPTLGAAFVLAGPLSLDRINLETGRGIVPVRLERDGPRIVFGRMDQPLPTWEPFAAEAELLAALGVERSELPVEMYDNGLQHVYVTLGSKAEVAALEPDMTRLSKLTGLLGANCIAGEGLSWKTRMFAPGDGITEDPGTGSAAGPLALHAARHGRIAFGDEIEIEQGTEIGRPCRLFARVDGSAERVERVEVGGSAVIVARGEFRL